MSIQVGGLRYGFSCTKRSSTITESLLGWWVSKCVVGGFKRSKLQEFRWINKKILPDKNKCFCILLKRSANYVSKISACNKHVNVLNVGLLSNLTLILRLPTLPDVLFHRQGFIRGRRLLSPAIPGVSVSNYLSCSMAYGIHQLKMKNRCWIFNWHLIRASSRMWNCN